MCLFPCLLTESGLSVQMNSSTGVNEGDRLTLTCKVGGVSGQLSVTWHYKSAPTTQFISVITLSQEGVMKKEEKFTSRKVRATRPASHTFTLELDEITASDSGTYQCTVSEWKTNSKTNSQSQTASVTVAPTGKMTSLQSA